MKFDDYMGKFASSGDVQTAVDNGNLVKPYVALVEDGNYIDWNTAKGLKDIPLTFEINGNGYLYWICSNSNFAATLEYSKNGGEWTEITATKEGAEIKVDEGDTVQFRGNNSTFLIFDELGNIRNHRFAVSVGYKLKGNIMSILDKDNFATLDTLQSAYTFSRLFDNNTVTDASKLILPATALTESCYDRMFYGSYIVNAPELPATTLANNCYRRMFNGCNHLATAPELPATTLASECYRYMFYNCSSLTTAPELPATTLTDWCYDGMFGGCSSLNYIKCLATDRTASNCTDYWVNGVASTGTFVKAAGVTWSEGTSGIPTGWTVQEI